MTILYFLGYVQDIKKVIENILCSYYDKKDLEKLLNDIPFYIDLIVELTSKERNFEKVCLLVRVFEKFLN